MADIQQNTPYLLRRGSYVSPDHLALCDAGPQSPRVRTRGIYLC